MTVSLATLINEIVNAPFVLAVFLATELIGTAPCVTRRAIMLRHSRRLLIHLAIPARGSDWSSTTPHSHRIGRTCTRSSTTAHSFGCCTGLDAMLASAATSRQLAVHLVTDSGWFIGGSDEEVPRRGRSRRPVEGRDPRSQSAFADARQEAGILPASSRTITESGRERSALPDENVASAKTVTDLVTLIQSAMVPMSRYAPHR